MFIGAETADRPWGGAASISAMVEKSTLTDAKDSPPSNVRLRRRGVLRSRPTMLRRMAP